MLFNLLIVTAVFCLAIPPGPTMQRWIAAVCALLMLVLLVIGASHTGWSWR